MSLVCGKLCRQSNLLSVANWPPPSMRRLALRRGASRYSVNRRCASSPTTCVQLLLPRPKTVERRYAPSAEGGDSSSPCTIGRRCRRRAGAGTSKREGGYPTSAYPAPRAPARSSALQRLLRRRQLSSLHPLHRFSGGYITNNRGERLLPR